jgi:hypothetical protein
MHGHCVKENVLICRDDGCLSAVSERMLGMVLPVLPGF